MAAKIGLEHVNISLCSNFWRESFVVRKQQMRQNRTFKLAITKQTFHNYLKVVGK